MSLKTLSPGYCFFGLSADCDFGRPFCCRFNKEFKLERVICRSDCQAQYKRIRKFFSGNGKLQVFLRIYCFVSVQSAVCRKLVKLASPCSRCESQIQRINFSIQLFARLADSAVQRGITDVKKVAEHTSDHFRKILTKLINQTFHGLLLSVIKFCLAPLFSHAPEKAS